jgi:uncharacterized protein YjbI with pentapeptide repeats
MSRFTASDFAQRMQQLSETGDAEIFSAVVNDDFDSADRDDPFSVGAGRSWIPVLGNVVWETSPEEEVGGYHAYIFELDADRLVGYIRIPDYRSNSKRIQHFAKIIERFNRETEALVIDQVNNPGGNLFHMYALLSMLTDKPLEVPRHEVTIWAEDVPAAVGVINRADEELPERVAYSRLILAEKGAGRGIPGRLSTPLYLNGIKHIFPAKVHYAKPIEILINGKTSSAGEFLAATFQDHAAARLFGETSAGAGGCGRQLNSKANLLKGMTFSMSWTLARRVNGDPIENRGVTPDTPYEITLSDIQLDASRRRLSGFVIAGFASYRRALLEELNRQLSTTVQPPRDWTLDVEPVYQDQLATIEQQHQLARTSRDAEGTRADFKGKTLRGLDLRGMKLQSVSFAHSDLRGADLSGADLGYANLYRASVQKAILCNADLAHACFCMADLSEANLRGAILRNAEFVRGNLSQADVTGADFRDATLSGADLSGVVGLTAAQLRDTYIAIDNPAKLPPYV